MSGGWVLEHGVLRQVESGQKKVLVYLLTGEVISSYTRLDRILVSLGWERYYDDPNQLQYHKRSSVHLISLPRDFSEFNSVHMYDIASKNPNLFDVRDSN